MTQSKHTPGPWSVYVPETPDATYGIGAPDGTAVVWYGRTSLDGIRSLDDAALIAASPEMYDVLARIVRNNWASAEDLSRAHAVLFKARGY